MKQFSTDLSSNIDDFPTGKLNFSDLRIKINNLLGFITHSELIGP